MLTRAWTPDPVDRGAAIAALEAEGLFVVEWTDAAGIEYPAHAHPSREIRVVLEGSMTMGVGDEEVELGAGDRVDMQADQRHWARVGPHGVRYLAATDSRPGVPAP